MLTRDRLSELLNDPEVYLRLPDSIRAWLTELIEADRFKRAGRLLHNQFAGGRMSSDSLKVCLEGHGADLSRSHWYGACKTITGYAVQAVATNHSLDLPNRVRDANLRSGRADVMELPDELVSVAYGLAFEDGEPAAVEAAAVLVYCVAILFEPDDWEKDFPVAEITLTLSAFKRLFVELIGGATLYVLGTCPEERSHLTTIKSFTEKLIKVQGQELEPVV